MDAKNLELVRLLIMHGADIKGVEDHLLVLKTTGGPELSSKLKALKERYAEDLDALEVVSAMGKIEAKALKVPKGLIDFFCFAWPAQNRSGICFHDADSIQGEISATPAEHLYSLGLVTIASNTSGNIFCIDINATKSLDDMPIYDFLVASDESYPYTDMLNDSMKVAGSWMEFLRYVSSYSMEKW